MLKTLSVFVIAIFAFVGVQAENASATTVPEFLAAYHAALVAQQAGAAPIGTFTYADSYAAIDLYFGPFGSNVVRCANGTVDRESGHNPNAGLPPGRVNRTHHGIFQLHDGFAGSIRAIAAARGEAPSFFNPYQNAWAAAQSFQHYGSFHANWPTTVPPGCP